MRWDVPTNFSRVDELLKGLRIGPWEYLNEPPLKEFILDNHPWFILAAAIFLGLILHGWRTERIASRRGEQVRDLMQRDLVHAERLEHMQRAGVVSQLSSLFAHEVKEPLANASRHAQGLVRELEQGTADPAKMTEVVERIVEETDRASEIVERVRAYAKGQGRKRERIRVDYLMNECVRVWRLYTPKPVTSSVKLSDPDLEIIGCGFELGVAFLNLLKNAREAVAGQEKPYVSFSCRTEDGRAVFEVADSGTPPTDELLGRLGAPASSARGLGLGLSIVTNIVESHGGTIAFERGPGGLLTGLLVRVTLPLPSSEKPEGES